MRNSTAAGKHRLLLIIRSHDDETPSMVDAHMQAGKPVADLLDIRPFFRIALAELSVDLLPPNALERTSKLLPMASSCAPSPAATWARVNGERQNEEGQNGRDG